MIFDGAHGSTRVGMTDDPYEAVIMAAQYLFNPLPDQLSDEQADMVKKLLLEQKKRVELYSDARAGELVASRTCPVVPGLSADIWRFKREYSYVDFRLPREGGFILSMLWRFHRQVPKMIWSTNLSIFSIALIYLLIMLINMRFALP